MKLYTHNVYIAKAVNSQVKYHFYYQICFGCLVSACGLLPCFPVTDGLLSLWNRKLKSTLSCIRCLGHGVLSQDLKSS